MSAIARLAREACPYALVAVVYTWVRKMSIKIFLVEDQTLMRIGLKMIVSNEVDIDVIGEAATGEDALAKIRHVHPDIVLCDFHLPGISGLEVTKRLVKSRPEVRVIIVSVLETGYLPKRLMDLGAFGYVGKGGESAELIKAIREVALGKRYLSNQIAQSMALGPHNGQQASPFDALTKRELEVALMLTRGLRQESIAKQLSLSAKTVNTHKARLFEKIGIKDNIALARLASAYGLVDIHHRL